MKIAIHQKNNGFSSKWIHYCKENDIPFKKVNCYRNDIISELSGCDGLMWHFHQSNPKDVLFARQLLYSLESAGFHVFPDFHTCWHFDDKVGQKYLLEAKGAPLVPSYVFYSRKEALDWIDRIRFPIIFKLRTGAGSANVQLIESKNDAKKCIYKAFGRGYRQYDPLSNLKERWRKYRLGKTDMDDMIKACARFIYPTGHDRVAGREKGYVYFQEFIAGNEYDIRVNIIDGKASAVRRKVRPNDFRASGSGEIDYDMNNIPLEAVEIAFSLTEKLKFQSMAYDFVMDGNKPKIVELSYGFGFLPTDFKTGYWDSDLNFHEGAFNPFGWMVDGFVKQIQKKSKTIKTP
ncbi:MAG: RimK family alpha-L-glutamate ligase [Balneolaceae bacterium]